MVFFHLKIELSADYTNCADFASGRAKNSARRGYRYALTMNLGRWSNPRSGSKPPRRNPEECSYPRRAEFFAPPGSSPHRVRDIHPGQRAYSGSKGRTSGQGRELAKAATSSFEDEDDDEGDWGACAPNDSKTGGKRWPSCGPGPVGGPDRPSVGAGLGRSPVGESLRQNRPHPGIG